MVNYMKRKISNQIDAGIVEINGQSVPLKKFKAKKNKRMKNVRHTITNCPNCLSSMRLNAHGSWECSADKLNVWEKDFIAFSQLGDKEKGEYLLGLSNYSRFIELFDKWKYSQDNNAPEEFNCGYTNTMYPMIGTASVRIPDPLVVKRIEHKLGRPLTEEELIGESELWAFGGRILTEWRKKAKQIRIPYIILPSETTVYV
jgi:hypothetical protein